MVATRCVLGLLAGLSLALTASAAETTVSVPEGVRITKSDKAIQLDALREGEQVTVKVQRREGRAVAVSVNVGPVAASAEQPRPNVIPRVRQALKAADEVLKQIE